MVLGILTLLKLLLCKSSNESKLEMAEGDFHKFCLHINILL